MTDTASERHSAAAGHFAFASLANDAHIVTGRHGGVTPGSLGPLNLSFAVGDDPANVIENRRRAFAVLGADLASAVFACQVHRTGIASVETEDRGRGALARSTAIPDCDGLITDSTGVWLALTFADCAPILLHDPVRRAVGIAHGGWRGTVAGVARAAVEAMTRAFGSDPADLAAGIGPSIGPCCYEVGPEVAAAARAGLPDGGELAISRRDGSPPGHAQLDLWAANRLVLIDAGIRPDRIEVAGICTSCNKDRFFSHRGDHGRTGRFAAIIGVGQHE